MAKRGRKPKEDKTSTYYFHEKEEAAVLDYLNTDSAEEKNRIYNTILRPAFEKMAESIIRRYRLYIPNEVFEDTFNDTLSFLITKMDKFVPGQWKAYSYYGTICRNYLTGKIDKYVNSLKRNPSYDAMAEEFNDNLKYSDKPDRNKEIAEETVQKLIVRITQMVENPQENDLKPNEIKLGKALVKLLEDWEYVLTTDASNKLNKNAVLLFLREETGMDTKGIRDNMRKFRQEFLLTKSLVIE